MAYIFASGSHIRICGGIFNAVNNTSGGTITIINRNTVQEWSTTNGASPSAERTGSSVQSGAQLHHSFIRVELMLILPLDYASDAAYGAQGPFARATCCAYIFFRRTSRLIRLPFQQTPVKMRRPVKQNKFHLEHVRRPKIRL